MNGIEGTLEEMYVKYVQDVVDRINEKRDISKQDKQDLKMHVKTMAQAWAKVTVHNSIVDRNKFDFESFYLSNKDKVSRKIAVMCKTLDAPLHYVLSRSRKREHSNVRQAIWKVVSDEYGRTEATYKMLGKIFSRDRGTIRHGIKEFNSLLEVKDPLSIHYFDKLTNNSCSCSE